MQINAIYLVVQLLHLCQAVPLVQVDLVLQFFQERQSFQVDLVSQRVPWLHQYQVLLVLLWCHQDRQVQLYQEVPEVRQLQEVHFHL